MKFFKTTCILFFTLSCFLANAEEFSFGSLGYTKHIAGDPHDSQNNTYYSDPEENGAAFGFGFGTKGDGFGSDLEITYYPEVTNKIAAATNAKVSSLATLSNFYAMPNVGNSSLIIGGGLGFAYNIVDTNYSSGGVTFNKEKTQFNFAYQGLIGVDLGEMQLIYKMSNFGEVKGGSGKASNNATYYSDEFDNKYHSLNLRFLF